MNVAATLQHLRKRKGVNFPPSARYLNLHVVAHPLARLHRPLPAIPWRATADRARLGAKESSIFNFTMLSYTSRTPSDSSPATHRVITHSVSAMKWTDRIGRRLKLHDLHILMTVAESGSMGKAAKALGISQPSVTKAISDIEHTIGVRLLDRLAEGAVLTVYGRALVIRGINAFDELSQGFRDIDILSDPTAGQVTIGCPEAIASGVLGAVLARFCVQFPCSELMRAAAKHSAFFLVTGRRAVGTLALVGSPPDCKNL